jgi:hypothetical protein
MQRLVGWLSPSKLQKEIFAISALLLFILYSPHLSAGNGIGLKWPAGFS